MKGLKVKIMTNYEIVSEAKMNLMEEGLIHGVLVDGEEIPEELYTFDQWKKQGRIVKKGEHAVTKLMLWVPTKRTRKMLDDNEGELDEKQKKSMRMSLRLSALFTKEQTQPAEEAEKEFKARAEERAKAKKAEKKDTKKTVKKQKTEKKSETVKKAKKQSTATVQAKPEKAKKSVKAKTSKKQGEQISALPVPVKSKAELSKLLKDKKPVYVKYTKNPHWKEIVGVERKVVKGNSVAIYIEYQKRNGQKSAPRLDYSDFSVKNGKMTFKFDKNRNAEIYTK